MNTHTHKYTQVHRNFTVVLSNFLIMNCLESILVYLQAFSIKVWGLEPQNACFLWGGNKRERELPFLLPTLLP